MSDATAAQGAERDGRRRGSDLSRRLLAALPLAAVALGATYLGGPVFYVLVAAIASLMAREWLRLARRPGLSRSSRYALIGAGFAVILLVAAAACWLRGGFADGRATMFWLCVVVWSTDSAAYLVGRTLKGPRLMPRVSPKKTWSGAIGGLAFAVLASIGIGEAADAAGWLEGVRPSLLRLALCGLAVGLLVELGDLFESWIKRRYGVKDTGRLIPGHGGFIDRLDGFSFAAIGMAIAFGAAGAGLLWAP